MSTISLSLEKGASIAMLSAHFWMNCCFTKEGLGSLDKIDPGCPYIHDIRRRRVDIRESCRGYSTRKGWFLYMAGLKFARVLTLEHYGGKRWAWRRKEKFPDL